MWEYKVLTWANTWSQLTAEQFLNSLGSQGWELTAVMHSSTHNTAHIYLKRKLKVEAKTPRPKAEVEVAKGK